MLKPIPPHPMSSTSQRYGHLAPAWTLQELGTQRHSIPFWGPLKRLRSSFLCWAQFELSYSHSLVPFIPWGVVTEQTPSSTWCPPTPPNFRRTRPGLSQSSLPGRHSCLSHIATGNLLITCSVKFLSLVCSFFIFLSTTSCSSSFPVFQAAFGCLCVDGCGWIQVCKPHTTTFPLCPSTTLTTPVL